MLDLPSVFTDNKGLTSFLMGAKVSKVLCYELNEVPWRVVDLYITKRPKSNLAKLLHSSAQLTTHTIDSGELHPWTTWPTVHRGVSNDTHNIRFLNQDLSSANEYQPIWQLVSDAGHSCGIFGSLQSYPAVTGENIEFHIPDTFAAGPETNPKRYTPFQAFNLLQTNENKAVAGKISMSHITMILGLLRTGIKPSTYLKIVKQLINEKKNPLYKSRRALLQPELAFDVFLSCLKKSQPQYVTFFSNHVAGIMHRYWKYSFPEDFEYTLTDSKKDQFHSQSIMVAMDIFDKQLGTLMDIAKRYEYDVVVMSSMGQEAIERGEYIPETKLSDFNSLLKRMQIEYSVIQHPAMQPDVAFEFDSTEDLIHFEYLLQNLNDSAGNAIFKKRLESIGKTLNLSMRSSKELVSDEYAYFGNEKIALSELGIELIERDIGTGYHQPEGILIWQNLTTDLEPRATVDSRRIMPTLLSAFKIESASYMQPKIT